MYSDKTQWGAPARRRTTQASGGDDYDNNSTQRYSTGGTNYYGLDGSESSASGGFTQVPRTSGGHSRSGSTGYHASNAEEAGYGTAGERTPREKVNQIVQAFFWKAAMIIIQSRMTVKFSLAARTQEKKTNKWVRFAPALLDAETNVEIVQYRTRRNGLV